MPAAVTALPDGVTVAWLRHADGAGRTIVFDPVEFFVGRDAVREEQRDGKGVQPGDTYIRNRSPELLRVRVAPSVAVTVNEMSNGGPTNVTWSWSRLVQRNAQLQTNGVLFRLRTMNGLVTGLSQQYQP